MHYHVCVVDGVFEAVVGEGEGDANADAQARPPGVVFHPASAIDAPAMAQVQAELRKRILQILNHIGVDSEPPQIAPARGPPL